MREWLRPEFCASSLQSTSASAIGAGVLADVEDRVEVRLDLEDDPLALGHVELVDQLARVAALARPRVGVLAPGRRAAHGAGRQGDGSLARAQRLACRSLGCGARCGGGGSSLPRRRHEAARARDGPHHQHVRGRRLAAHPEHGLRLLGRVVRDGLALRVEQRRVEIAQAVSADGHDGRAARAQLQGSPRLGPLRQRALAERARPARGPSRRACCARPRSAARARRRAGPLEAHAVTTGKARQAATARRVAALDIGGRGLAYWR